MNYFLKKKKWLAWVIMLTFLFTSILPSNIMAGNSVAEAADANYTITVGGTQDIEGTGGWDTNSHQWLSSDYGIASVTQGSKWNPAKATVTGISDGKVTIKHSYLKYKGDDLDDLLDPNEWVLRTETWTVIVGNGGSSGGDGDTSNPPIEGDAEFTKSFVKRTGPDEWQVTMEIGANQVDVEAPSLDIALVIDYSSSMGTTKMNNAKAAAKKFVEDFSKKGIAANLGVVIFDERATVLQEMTAISTKDGAIADNVKTVTDKIGTIKKDSGTNIHDGLIKANTLLNGSKNAYIVLLSDGEPYDYVGNNGEITGGEPSECKPPTTAYATTLKNEGIKILTIAFDVDDTSFFDGLSSGKGYHFESEVSEDGLNAIFQKISDQILYVMASGIVTDDMAVAPSDVNLVIDSETKEPNIVEKKPDKSTVGLDEQGRLVWNIPTKVTRDEPAKLTYTVKAKDLKVGQQTPTLNGKADLAYKDSNGTDKSATATNPTGTYEAGQLTVSYDGLPTGVTPPWSDSTITKTEWKSDVKVTDWKETPANVTFPTVNPVGDFEVTSVTVTKGNGDTETLSLADFQKKYKNNVITLQTGNSKIVYHYTTKFTFTKVDGDDNNAPMENVGFRLVEGTTNSLPTQNVGKYAKVGITDRNGNITFDGLELGKTYTLSEITPTGYQQKGPWTITVGDDGRINGLLE